MALKYSHYLLFFLPGKRRGLLFKEVCVPFSQQYVVQSLVKIYLDVLENRKIKMWMVY